MKIYAFQTGEDGPIKIGISGTLEKRMRSIQRNVPYPLRLLGAREGNYLNEGAVKLRLKKFRMIGEWFFPHKEVVDFLIDLLSGKIDFPLLEKKPRNAQYRTETSCRKNMLLLAKTLAKAKGVKLSSISREFYGDGRTFDQFVEIEKHGGDGGLSSWNFAVRKYDEVIWQFCKQWPRDLEFPELLFDDRNPSWVKKKIAKMNRLHDARVKRRQAKNDERQDAASDGRRRPDNLPGRAGRRVDGNTHGSGAGRTLSAAPLVIDNRPRRARARKGGRADARDGDAGAE